MDLIKLTKQELIQKCKELGFMEIKSKNKKELIELINENINHLKPLVKWSGDERNLLHRFLNNICHFQKIHLVAQERINNNFIGCIHNTSGITSLLKGLHR